MNSGKRRKVRHATASAIVFALLAVVVPLSSAEGSEPSECVTSNLAAISGSSPSTEVGSGMVDSESVDSEIIDDSDFAAALQFLAESTDFLDQSDSLAPVIDDGKLQSTCEIAFELEGTQSEINAKGVSGLKISSTARWLVQALEGNRGHRMMVVLKDSTASATHTVDLKLSSNLSVVSLDDGGAVFLDETNHVVGSILAPWALDANNNPVPITQTVTSTSITITVETNADTAWPIIADPTYHNLNCTASMVTTTGTASQYLNGSRCPRYADIIARGYYPKWIHHFERWRVGKPSGDCTGIPERLDTWNPKDIKEILIILGLQSTTKIAFGVIYDFHQACQGHDYCYDLGHSGRLNYPNISKASCDSIMYNDMKYDCSKRRSHVKPLCRLIAEGGYILVQNLGSF